MTHTHAHTRPTFPQFHHSQSQTEKETQRGRESGRDSFSLQAAAVAVPMRKQSTPWDRSPQIEPALGTIMRLNDERVMPVFLRSCCSARSVALRSAIPWDTVPPSMALLSAFRTHWMAAWSKGKPGERAPHLPVWINAPRTTSRSEGVSGVFPPLHYSCSAGVDWGFTGRRRRQREGRGEGGGGGGGGVRSRLSMPVSIVSAVDDGRSSRQTRLRDSSLKVWDRLSTHLRGWVHVGTVPKLYSTPAHSKQLTLLRYRCLELNG